MNKLKILLLIPLAAMLCGCTQKEYKELTENELSIISLSEANGVVTSCSCPDVFVRPVLWGAFLVDQKKTVGQVYTKKCQSKVNFRDAYNDKIIMKCDIDKCKIYE